MERTVDTLIIGGGLTGLTLAYYLHKAGKHIALVEKSERFGGVIETREKNGFTYERGPSTGVLGSAELVTLFDDLAGKCELETAEPSSKRRLILYKGKWQEMPSGLGSAVTTPLFSWHDKFRILGEPFRKKGANPDETLADLVKRRMGVSFLNYAIDPFISGVYAGDPQTLVTRYAMPKLYNLEQNYGSFIGGAIKKGKEPKTELEKRVTKEVFSAHGGLGKLITALESSLPDEAKYAGCANIKTAPDSNGFTSTITRNGETFSIRSARVVSTVPAPALTPIFDFIPSAQLDKLTALRYAKVVQVAVGFHTWKGLPVKAFGGLVPTLERKDYLGILFPSSIFDGRSPAGGALFSVFLGGIKKPQIFEKPDSEITKIVKEAFESTLMLKDFAPDLFEIHRYPLAIPQYDITSGERFRAILEVEETWPGLHIAGNIRDGIGISDRVKQAVTLAKELS